MQRSATALTATPRFNNNKNRIQYKIMPKLVSVVKFSGFRSGSSDVDHGVEGS